MPKISFSDIIGIAGIVLAVILIVLDKAGKLKGHWLFILLGVAALMTLFIALGNSWVMDAPHKWRLWRGALSVCITMLTYSGIAIWISPSKSEESSGKPAALATAIPYPLIAGNATLVATGKPVQAVRLSAYVWDWPTTNDDLMRGKVPIDSLLHFKVSVSRVELIVGNGWRATTVMQVDEPTEWNNVDAPQKPSGWIPLDRDITVFTYRAEARKSFWDGYLILRKVGSNLEREEATTGSIALDSGGPPHKMAITVFTSYSNGRLTTSSQSEYRPMTNDRLRELGIPEIKQR